MKKTFKYFLFFCLFSIFLIPQKSFAADYNLEKIFYLPAFNAVKGVASLEKNWQKIDILSPQYHVLTANLKITGSFGPKLKKIIKDRNLKVMPLVANANFNQNTIHKLLTSPESQDKIIQRLVDLASANKYIGWQFDFENISYLDKDLYSSFVEKSAESLHKNGLILSVAATSRSVDYEDTDAFKNWGGVFDYARIAKAVDFVSLMTYDDPDSVGPVASLPFIDKVLNYVKDKIPPEKLSLGIPLYNWGWSTNPFKKTIASGTYDGLLYIRSNFRHDLGFSDALGAAWLTYLYNNKQYQIWYQNKQSFENKLDVIKQNNFRGFSAWVMGVEDPEIWSVLAKTKK